jgi:protease I
MEKNSIIIAGNYVQDHEFIYPYYRLLEEEFKVTVVINENQKVKGILGTDIPPNKDQKILSIEEVNEKDFNLLIIPGGVKSMEKVRQNKKIINFISNFNNQGKVIGCICSGVQLLISAKVVKNRRISGYYALEDDITNAGAIYTDLPAVIDDNIITTAHYKDLGPWMKSVLENFYKRNFNDK